MICCADTARVLLHRHRSAQRWCWKHDSWRRWRWCSTGSVFKLGRRSRVWGTTWTSATGEARWAPAYLSTRR